MKTIVRLDPFAEIRRLTDWLGEGSGEGTEQVGTRMLPIDVIENEDALVVRASVPGVRPEDLQITVENSVLTLRGEHRSENVTENAKIYRREVAVGSFARSIRLPETLNAEQAQAVHEHGLVTIRIPKVEEAKPKTIQVPVTRPTDAPTTN